MKKPGLVYTIILALAFSFQANAQKDPKAKTVLDAMSQKFQKMNGFTASFDYTFQDATGVGDVQSGEIAVKGEQYRLKLPDQEIYNDGKTVWTFIQSDNYMEVTINDAREMEGELTPSTIYRLYQSGYGYALIDEKQYQGKTAQVIELIAEKKNAPFEEVKLMVDKNSQDLLGWEMADGQGGVFIYTFKNLKTNANLPSSHFVFDPKKYPGVEVIDLR